MKPTIEITKLGEQITINFLLLDKRILIEDSISTLTDPHVDISGEVLLSFNGKQDYVKIGQTFRIKEIQPKEEKSVKFDSDEIYHALKDKINSLRIIQEEPKYWYVKDYDFLMSVIDLCLNYGGNCYECI